MTSYLLLVLSHAVGDLILQTRVMEDQKITSRGAISHAAHLCLVSFLATHVFGLGNALKMAAAVGLAHLGLDRGWAVLRAKSGPLVAILIFVGEQISHLYVLAWVARFWGASPDPRVLGVWSILVPPLSTPFFSEFSRIGLTQRTLASLIVYIYVACAGSTLIRLSLQSIGLTRQAASDAPQCGKYIGILERTIILTFMLNGALAAAAFVLTAKSIARYPQISEDRKEGQQFAEYYLIGTLLSALVAVMGGLLLQTLWRSLG